MSNKGAITVDTVPRLVMAEQITHDVVNEAQSMGGSTPIDVNATSTNQTTAGDGQTATDTTANSNSSEAPAKFPSHVLEKTAPEASNSGAKPAADDPDQETGNEAMADKANTPPVNGIAAEHATAEEISGQQAVADASGGSDTDTSRAESLGQSKDGKSRSSSVKKPTSFKSVSVTKHFLAKTAVAAPTKVGEKAASGQSTPTIQPTAKPRLVAKSGSGVGSSAPRTGLSNLNGAAPGPDGSKVWNKNRPVPVPPPKQFTDEELKQQFGIHMATRLQADDESKESKWADIDDDEDDWAPETVEWMDGTKSTVKATENVPPPEEPKPKPSEPEQSSEASKQPVPAATAPVSRPNSTSGTKTILKPGSLASTGSPKPAGLVLKGQPDKPTLVAKPSAPSAVKSPWAPLPPIEKVSPVVINPPVQQQASARLSQRDPHGFDALGQAPSPAKEIAADDFNRSWREERGPRELFNSQSGRYEPVREMRRGSVRDQNFRQPSVLQRPSHQEQGGPAEPSASFQTSRSGAGHEYGGRRRTSSNVSGDAGRRGSFSRPQEFAVSMDDRRRRGSHALTDMPPPPPRSARSQQRGGIVERGPSPAVPSPVGPPPAALTQHPSPAVSQAQPASPLLPSVSTAPSEPVVSATQVSASQLEDDAVARQNKMMREKVEAARQRKKEEAERDEAERKEKIRRKLESLGPPPEKTSEKAKSPAPAAAEVDTDKKPAPVQSPPKPPVPTADGEVAQYGMMKVHQAHPVKKHVGEQLQSRRQGDYAQSHASQADAKRHDAPSSLGGAAQDVATPSTAPFERESPLWKPTQSPESHAVWGGGRMRSHGIGGNVWAPANQERHVVGHIGNGTFAGHTQPSHMKGRSPGPIAPPPAFRTSPSKAADLAQPSLSHPNTFDREKFERQTFNNQHSLDHSNPPDHRQDHTNHPYLHDQQSQMSSYAQRGGRRIGGPPRPGAPVTRPPRNYNTPEFLAIHQQIRASDRAIAEQTNQRVEQLRLERADTSRPVVTNETREQRTKSSLKKKPQTGISWNCNNGVWEELKPSAEMSNAPSTAPAPKADASAVQKPALADARDAPSGPQLNIANEIPYGPDLPTVNEHGEPFENRIQLMDYLMLCKLQVEPEEQKRSAPPQKPTKVVYSGWRKGPEEKKSKEPFMQDTSVPPHMRNAAFYQQQQNATVPHDTNNSPQLKPTANDDFTIEVEYTSMRKKPEDKSKPQVTHDTNVPPHVRKTMRLQQQQQIDADRQNMANGQNNTAAPITGPHKPIGSVGAILPPIGAEKSAAAQQAANHNTSGNGRSSRFFPRSNEVSPQVFQVQLPPTPPPESETHPAFSGDARNPVVKLPKTPTVKLPPVSSAPRVIMPPRASDTPNLQIGSKPIVAQQAFIERLGDAAIQTSSQLPSRANSGSVPRIYEQDRANREPHSRIEQNKMGWQGRIDSLFQKEPQHLFSALPLASVSPGPAEPTSTKAPLDHAMHRKTATVSLPSKDGVSKGTYSQVAAGSLASAIPTKLSAENIAPDVVSKPSVEDEVMDQPVAFSKPTVCMPKGSHLGAWLPDFPATTNLLVPKLPKDVEGPTFEEAASIMIAKASESDRIMNVRLPGMLDTKSVVVRNKDFNYNHTQAQSRKTSSKFKGKKKTNNPRSEQDNVANGVSGNNEPTGNPNYGGTGGHKTSHGNARFGQGNGANGQRYNSGDRPHVRNSNNGAQGNGGNAGTLSKMASGDARLHPNPNASGQGFAQGNMNRSNPSGRWSRNADMSGESGAAGGGSGAAGGGGSGTATSQHNGPRSTSHGNWYSKKTNKPNRGGGQGSSWDNSRRPSGDVRRSSGAVQQGTSA